MKPALQAKLGTALALTPQLRQAIRLLQLSQAELEAELQAAVEANPLLERVESGGDEGGAEPLGDEGADERGPEGADTASDGEADAATDGDGEPDPLEALDENWSLGSEDLGPRMPEEEDGREPASSEPGLRAHLLWQLHMSLHSPRDLAIGEAIIDALDEDGYLREPLEALAAATGLSPPPDAGELRAVLHHVQQLDPPGCGARDLGECLRLQLALLDPATPGLALARRLAEGHLEALARLPPERLAERLGEPVEAVASASALLRRLDPRPGARHAGAMPEYVQPDAMVLRQHGVWRVRMLHGPGLRIARHYERLIGRCRQEDDAWLRGQLQEARWLIRALENRSDTLRRVAEAIVRAQSGFLDHGPEAMRPLTLRDIAEELGLHESTISRATTRKYLRTPRGTFEFKHFFGAGLATEHGGAASALAVQALIRRLIAAEPPGKPLSDQALAEQLKAQGIQVARRTVAKYREALGIPPSSERGGREGRPAEI